MHLVWKPWGDLALAEFYEAAALRERVFVVEQNCVYPDLDGLDAQAEHLLASEGGRLIAYLRILPPGTRYERDFSIGRVVVAPEARGRGIARGIMNAAIGRIQERQGPDASIRISAQVYLETFYASLGFRTVRGPYDDHGIPHCEMELPWN